jgi:hypothetical protein
MEKDKEERRKIFFSLRLVGEAEAFRERDIATAL